MKTKEDIKFELKGLKLFVDVLEENYQDMIKALAKQRKTIEGMNSKIVKLQEEIDENPNSK